MPPPNMFQRLVPVSLAAATAVLAVIALRDLGDLGRLETRIAASFGQQQRGQAAIQEVHRISDDLTRMARLYAGTGEDRYRQLYRQIAAIRDGESPRPEPYPGIHWHLVAANREAPRPAGQAVSFRELAGRVGFSEREAGLLRLSSDRAVRLAEVEAQTLAAETSRELLAGTARLQTATYLAYKAEAVTPVAELEAVFNARITRERATQVEEGREARASLRRMLWGALILSLIAAATALVRPRSPFF